jgi:hypothetical protein
LGASAIIASAPAAVARPITIMLYYLTGKKAGFFSR